MVQNSKRTRRRSRLRAPVEDRRAEAVTVAWMLCVLAAFFAEVVAGVAWLVITWTGNVPQTVQVIPRLMLFLALLSGMVSLVLLPLAYYLSLIHI